MSNAENFYHITNFRNRDNILKEGLLISKAESTGYFLPEFDLKGISIDNEPYRSNYARFLEENRMPLICLSSQTHFRKWLTPMEDRHGEIIVFQVSAESVFLKNHGIDSTDSCALLLIQRYLESNPYEKSHTLEYIIKQYGTIAVFENIPPTEISIFPL